MSDIKQASVLAFERNLDISDGFLYQQNSQDKNPTTTPVEVHKKSVRGTISNRLKNAMAADPIKLDAEIRNANLHTVETASLDEGNDTLCARWSCKILPFTGKPCVCDQPQIQAQILQVVSEYQERFGFDELAKRYAYNIINGRWLWRNRVGAEQIEITVGQKINHQDETLEFSDVHNLDLNNFNQEPPQLDKLSTWIAEALKDTKPTILYIQSQAKIGYGQEVYPSQELILDSRDKVLYQLKNIAGIHSQKIGNAIRTVDTWYNENPRFPIAAEPYGSVTTLGSAFRQPKQKKDFYHLFDDWILNDKEPSDEQQHYVMAILIRGGVFGASSKE